MILYKVIREALVISVLVYSAGKVLVQWNSYASCYTPIHSFLLAAYILILLHRFMDILTQKSQLSNNTGASVASLFKCILQPALTYVTLKGILFHLINLKYTPTCGPNQGDTWLIWTTILILVSMKIKSIVYSACNLFISLMFRIIEKGLFSALSEIRMTSSVLNEHNNHARSFEIYQKDWIRLDIEEINKIQTEVFSESNSVEIKTNQESCAICFEDFALGEGICVLPLCNHTFHKSCAHDWLKRSLLCPMCRSNIRSNLELEAS